MFYVFFFLFWVSSFNLVLGIESIHIYHRPPPSFNKTPTYFYKTKWFTQTIDHFSFVSNGTFQQRYLINDTWWEGKGDPVFIYAGNEGDIEAFAQNTGFMWDIAPEFNALVIFVEHRYYGKSLPFGEDSLKPDPKFNGYLNSEQALADYAEFILDLKRNLKGAGDSPFIVFGGSYGGMLAAWLRMKYPHVVDGAIAGSAPIAQFDAPCQAFARIVTSDYRAQDKLCSVIIQRSWEAIDNLTKTDDGKKWLNDQWKMCKPIKTAEDAEKLKEYLSDLWTNVAMMDYPYPTTFLMPLPGNPVSVICSKMVEEDVPKDPKQLLTNLFKGVSVYFNFTGSAKCLSYEDPDQIGADMWDYQACTEMVMPFCSDNVNDMFEKIPWNFTEYSDECLKKWKVIPKPNMADMMYGAKKISAASNIVFSNGLLDPWSSGGIMRSESPSVVTLIIPEGAHHLDLRGANKNDPPSVIQARKIERSYIRKWIMQARKKPGGGGPYGPGPRDVMV